MTRRETVRNVVFALLGVAVLVLKPYYHGPFEELVYDHAGNFSVSFTVYFIARIGASRWGLERGVAAAAALIAVTAFELLDGFGVMENVYDEGDLVANTLGVGVAVLVDVATARLTGGTQERGE